MGIDCTHDLLLPKQGKIDTHNKEGDTMSDTATLTKPTASAKEVKTNHLNATHRCDRCSAAAFVQVHMKISENLPEGGHLLFCGHHYTKYEVALVPFTDSLTDERHKLVYDRHTGTENS